MSVAATEVSLASPYKGLAPFDDTDADALLFFGREWETEVVAANVLAARLTVLYGPSGVGKSSLLRAGVVRALRQSGQPSPAVAVFGSWADEPLAGLEGAARAAVAEALGRDPADAPGGLTDRLAAWSAELGAELCLLVDQLEELFLYHPAKEGAAGFVDLLPELVLRPGLRVNVLLGVRDDALAQLDVFKERIPGLFMNSLRLDHLDREAARAAILGPLARFAAIAGVAGAMEIEPELVDGVLDEVAAGRIEPSIAGVGAVEGTARAGRIETPYLQLVLQRLWEVERERGSTTMKLETLRSLGGAERIVQNHLERALASLSPAQKAAAASVFGHLVTPSGTKIAHGTSDLATYADLDEREIRPVLDSLSRQRILRPLGENGYAGDRYEIFHDVLAGAVLAWRTRHEADAALAVERKRRKRLAWLAAAALIGLALMAALAAYAFSQRSEARKQSAVAQHEKDEARSLAKKRQHALLLAGAAQRRAQTQKKVALTQKVLADQATADANEQREKADSLNAVAQKQEQLAISGQQSAKHATNVARAAESDAKRQAKIADAQTQKAENAAKQAKVASDKADAAAKQARARLFISRSVSLVGRDPEASATAAVQASELAEKQDDLLDAENALRAALVAMRVQQVLPGAGPGGAQLASLSSERRNTSAGAEVAHFSADGRRIAVGVGAGSRDVRVYRVRKAKLLRTFTAGAVVQDVAISRDGRYVAAAGEDGRVWVWDVDTRNVRQLEHGPPVSAVAWSPTTDLLVSVGGTVARVWDIVTGGQRSLTPQRDPLHAVVFSRDGSLVATYGDGPFVRIFNVATGIRTATLPHPSGASAITSAAFGPRGDVMVTGRGNVARLWSLETSQVIRFFPGHSSTVSDVAFSEDGERVATGSVDTLARVFIVSTGALEDGFYGHSGLGINDVDFSPEQGSNALVTAGADHTARFFARGQASVPLLGHRRAVLGASFSPDGRSVLTSSKDGTARLFDPYGEPRPDVLADYGPSGKVNSVAVDPSGSLVAAGGQDGAVHVLSVKGKLLGTPVEAGGSPIVSVAWAHGQKLLAATRDGHVQIWSNAGASLAQEVAHGGTINAAAISSDGSLAATAGQDHVARVWRLKGGGPSALTHTGPVSAVAFDPTGEVLATASGKAAYTWSTARGNSLKTFQTEGQGDVTALAFGHRGDVLATTSDSYPRTWTTKTGQLRKTFVRHGSNVQGVAFSPDGRWFATVAVRKAAVWQVGESDLDGNFLLFVARPAPQPPLTSVAFSPNDTVVMGNSAGQVLAYRCRFCGGLPQLVTIARRKLARLDREAKQ